MQASAREAMLARMLKDAPTVDFKLPPSARTAAGSGDPEHTGGVTLLVRAAVNAFFDQDLYVATSSIRHRYTYDTRYN